MASFKKIKKKKVTMARMKTYYLVAHLAIEDIYISIRNSIYVDLKSE